MHLALISLLGKAVLYMGECQALAPCVQSRGGVFFFFFSHTHGCMKGLLDFFILLCLMLDAPKAIVERTLNPKHSLMTREIAVPTSLWLLRPLFCHVPLNMMATFVDHTSPAASSLARERFLLTAFVAAACTFLAMAVKGLWCTDFGGPRIAQNLTSCSCLTSIMYSATTDFIRVHGKGAPVLLRVGISLMPLHDGDMWLEVYVDETTVARHASLRQYSSKNRCESALLCCHFSDTQITS